MFIWLAAHIADIVIIAVILAAVFFVIRGMIRDKKAGKSSCGGSCAGCGACAGCSGCSTGEGSNARTAELSLKKQNSGL